MPKPDFQAIQLSGEEWNAILTPFVRTDKPKAILRKLLEWGNAPVAVDWFHGDEQVIRSINQTLKKLDLPFRLVNSWTKAPRPQRQYFTQIHKIHKLTNRHITISSLCGRDGDGQL